MQIRQRQRETTQTKSDFMNDFSAYQYEDSGFHGENFYIRRSDEIKRLRKLSFFAGLAVIAYVVIQNLIVFMMQISGTVDVYLNNDYFRSGIDILMTILGIFVPFSIAGRKMKEVSGVYEPVMTERPISLKLFVLGTIGCSGCIMIANIISSYINYFISLGGYELENADIEMPDGVFGLVLSFIRISILAAFVEEYCLRGHVMGNLRRYGDAFAIAMSATVFALMHGTLMQVPFALISGFALGYFSVKTNSIWPAIIGHAVNNGLSVAITYLMKVMSEEDAMLIYSDVMYMLILAGLLCTLIFVKNTKKNPLSKGEASLSTTEKAAGFLLTPTTLIAIIIMVMITAESVSG